MGRRGRIPGDPDRLTGLARPDPAQAELRLGDRRRGIESALEPRPPDPNPGGVGRVRPGDCGHGHLRGGVMTDGLRPWAIIMLVAGGVFTGGLVSYAWERV